MGGAPRLENIDNSLQTEKKPTNAEFLRRLSLILRKDVVAESESHILNMPCVFTLKASFLTLRLLSSRTSFSHGRC